MGYKSIKIAPLLLSASIVSLTGITHASQVYAAQLNLNSPEGRIEGSDFAIPFDSILQESGVVESTVEPSDNASFNCNFEPANSEDEVQPEGVDLSYLGPNLVAQAGAPLSISPSGPIIPENCALEGVPIGGPAGAGFPFAALAGLPLAGLIPLLSDGDDSPAVPEPIAIPFIFSALGIGAVVARKRIGTSGSDKKS